MRVNKNIVLIVIILFAAGGIFTVLRNKQDHATGNEKAIYFCPMHPTYTSDRTGDCPICFMKLVKLEESEQKPVDTSIENKVVYHCPMHPEVVSDKPGVCPKCNMKLVKREEPLPGTGTSQSPEEICIMHNCTMMKPGETCAMMIIGNAGETISCTVCGTYVPDPKNNDLLIKVHYWTDPGKPGSKFDKPGKTSAGTDLIPVYEESSDGSQNINPMGYVPILMTPQKLQLIGIRTAKIEKRLISKTIRTVGRIAYDPDLYQAEQEYISSMRSWREASQNSKATDAAVNAKRLVASSQMRLKLLGLSSEMIEEMALWDEPDKSLLLTDPDGKAWVYAPIYEYELPLVKVGQEIAVEISAVSGKIMKGTIKSIDSVLDPLTRTAKARATIVDPEGGLKPEMYVNVSIAVNPGEVLAIPEEAVFNTGVKQIVFVDKGNGLFEPREVTVGFKTDEYYELKDGVREGESVVTSGNFLIDSESRLKAAFEGMSGGDSHQHGQ